MSFAPLQDPNGEAYPSELGQHASADARALAQLFRRDSVSVRQTTALSRRPIALPTRSCVCRNRLPRPLELLEPALLAEPFSELCRLFHGVGLCRSVPRKISSGGNRLRRVGSCARVARCAAPFCRTRRGQNHASAGSGWSLFAGFSYGGRCCQRATDPSREEETFSLSDLLSMKEKPGLAHAATPAAATALHRIERGGQPIDHATRTSMEGRFGQDFGRVRIHREPGGRGGGGDRRARLTFGAHAPWRRVLKISSVTIPRAATNLPTFAADRHSRPGPAHLRLHDRPPRDRKRHTGLAPLFRIWQPMTTALSRHPIRATTASRGRLVHQSVDLGPSGLGLWRRRWTAPIADFDAFYQATQSLTPTDQPNSNSLGALSQREPIRRTRAHERLSAERGQTPTSNSEQGDPRLNNSKAVPFMEYGATTSSSSRSMIEDDFATLRGLETT